MIKQRVLLTVTENNPGLTQSLGQEISRCGLDAMGHMLSAEASDRDILTSVLPALIAELARPETDGWVIAGTAKSLSDPRVRCTLSLAALGADAVREKPLPILLSPSGGPVAQPLPTPLADARISSAAIGAQAVAMLHTKRTAPRREYRAGLVALAGLGLWIEAGPADGVWNGVLIGMSDLEGKPLEANSFGIGQAGIVPQKSTLEYPVRGLQAEVGGMTFSACGAANRLSVAESGFLQPSALPGAVFLGPFPADDDPELWTIRLI